MERSYADAVLGRPSHEPGNGPRIEASIPGEFIPDGTVEKVKPPVESTRDANIVVNDLDISGSGNLPDISKLLMSLLSPVKQYGFRAQFWGQ